MADTVTFHTVQTIYYQHNYLKTTKQKQDKHEDRLFPDSFILFIDGIRTNEKPQMGQLYFSIADPGK